MVSKCLNPACNKPFRVFRTGTLFLVDDPRVPGQLNSPAFAGNTIRRPEYFWLCGECSSTMEVSVDRDGSVGVARRTVVTQGRTLRRSAE